MADVGQTQAQRSSNLARIRDNQRRSRARRKEYLQELEAKHRHCELIGIEASAEIQAAARKVVDENKRLRQLLKHHGLSNAEIDGVPANCADTAPYSSAMSELERMLVTKRHCTPGSSASCEDASRRRSLATSTPATSVGQHSPVRHSQQITPAAFPPKSAYPQNHHSPQSSISSSNGIIETPTTPQCPKPRAGSAPFAMQTTPVAHQPAMDHEVQSYDHAPAWTHQYQHPQDYFRQVSPPTPVGSNACYFSAVDGVRTVKHEGQCDMGQEHGYANGGHDCSNLPNAQMFNLMDWYGGASILI